MKILIKIRNVNVSYSKERKIFKDINLDIIKQDFILINGENGCGKSSFLKLLYMQLLPNNGKIIIFDKEIDNNSKKDIIKNRKKMGVILQNDYLIPYLTVNQNIEISNFIQNTKKKDYNLRVKEILDWAGLKDIKNEKIHNLSDGEKQKVIIARSLVSKPDILIADEPITYLDNTTKEKFFFLLSSINKLGTTIIMTSKMPLEIPNLRTRKLIIKNGQLIENI
ncbi:MAG: hypothetical protein CMM91_02605 [Rickettsiales bacterium]|nr:hypothetical protein [Rickettsiales bacterium]OUV54534.1 MAG: hypothetical protein CBC87_01350 [Rickettsiales bacterium TMED127]|tara:strand:- start:43993 stop:44661 length:669 start_codon:yes stop_codon:yes gene_type:complete